MQGLRATKRTTFWRRPCSSRSGAVALPWLRAEIEIPSSSRRRRRQSFIRSGRVRQHGLALRRFESATGSIRSRSRLHCTSRRPDRLPGARGVGAQTAAGLLRKYITLEALLASGRFAEQSGDLRLYRRIATMDASAPLPSLRAQKPTWLKAAQLAGEWDLARLAAPLEDLSKGKAAQP